MAFIRAIGADDLTLTLRDIRIVADDPGSPDGRPEILKGELTVAGWFLAVDRP